MKTNPITALFAPIEKLIIEHGSAAVRQDHIALLKDELAVIKEKFAVVVAENVNLKSENLDLKEQIYAMKEKDAIKGDRCPYCQKNHGKLMDLKPHPIFGEVGIKVGDYHCESCGRNYDKEHKP